MGKRAWTAHGEMQEADRAVIRAVADKNPVAARIFVTGEAAESYLGDAAVRLLININDTLYQDGASCEPLFVQTRDDTVRMVRFDPDFVWRCFDPDMLVPLIEAEAARLHVPVDPWGMEKFDFYEEMASALSKRAGDSVPIAWKDSGIDAFYSAVYLSCLLLFGKPGYLDIPVAQHFAQPKVAQWMAQIDYRKLSIPEMDKLVRLRKDYGHIQALTNPELHFVVDLFQKRGSA